MAENIIPIRRNITPAEMRHLYLELKECMEFEGLAADSEYSAACDRRFDAELAFKRAFLEVNGFKPEALRDIF